jgi:hypothetical protein
MLRNGVLPDEELAAIPAGRLRRDAAAAWNAMNDESVRRYGVVLRPLGPMSSYRTLAEQTLLRRQWCAQGACGNAAVPGASNHGWGLAVDVASQRIRWVIDQIGRRYGYVKAWSDAPQEWWHIRYRPGIWNGPIPPAGPPTLHRGQSGPSIRALQRALRRRGFRSVRVTGYFGIATVRAVSRVQRRHGLAADGVVGQKTWNVLS